MPIHKACLFGNPTVVQWIVDKWDEYHVLLDVDAIDQHGYTPLYLVCYKGYLGTEGVTSNAPDTREKRMECVKTLLRRGANINYVTPKLNMTPLHWAAYSGDADLIQLLLDNGAVQLPNSYGFYPVDMAGFCKNTEVI